MRSKTENREITRLYWISFGKMMGKHMSASGERISWTNYRVGLKDLYVRLWADKRLVRFSIELQMADPDIRLLFYEQFEELKTVLNSAFENRLEWHKNALNQTGETVCMICCEHPGNLFDQGQWSGMFKFMEAQMLCWDNFWCDFTDVFLELAR